LENGYYWDANAIFWNSCRWWEMELLKFWWQDAKPGHEVFTELGSNATGANRMNAMHRYQRISNMYVRDEWKFSALLEVYFGRDNICQTATMEQQKKVGWWSKAHNPKEECVRFAFPCTRMTLAQIEMNV
jgi:hypothetical protein